MEANLSGVSDQSGMSMSSRPVRVRVRSLFSLRSRISAALTVILYSQVVTFDSPLNRPYAPVGRQQGLLGDLFGVLGPAHHLERDVIDEVGVLFYDLLEIGNHC